MTNSTERTQTTVRLGQGKIDRLKQLDISQQAIYEAAVDAVIETGDPVEAKIRALEKQKENLDEEKADLLAEREQIDDRINEIEREQDGIDDRIDEIQTGQEQQQQRYEDALVELEDKLAEGTHVVEDHVTVKRAAEILDDKTPADVITDLKDRNPTVPDYAFESYMHAECEWTGFETESRYADD